MNTQLSNFARQELKSGLAMLPEKNHYLFKMMYARNGGKRSVLYHSHYTSRVQDPSAQYCVGIFSYITFLFMDGMVMKVTFSTFKSKKADARIEQIMTMTKDRELTTAEICNALGMERAAISKYLNYMYGEGMLLMTRRVKNCPWLFALHVPYQV